MTNQEERLIRVEAKLDGIHTLLSNHLKHHLMYNKILAIAMTSLIIGLLLK